MAWQDLPPKVQAAFDHLRRPVNQDPVQWARKVLAKHESGQTVASATLQMACEALGISYPPPKLRKENHG